MGFLDSLGKAARWMKDSPVGQVVDAAFSPVDDDSALMDLARGLNDVAKYMPSYKAHQAIFGSADDTAAMLDTAYDQGVRPWSTVNLQIKHIADGEFGNFVSPTAWKKSWQTSDKVTLAQAATTGGIASLATRPAARIADSNLSRKDREKFYKVYPWLREDFDIADTKQRNEAFRESVTGKYLTGGQDLLARWYLDPGNAVLLGGMRLKHIRDVKTGRLITSENFDTATQATHTERVLDWIDAERAKGGDIAARLHNHPALRKNSHGGWIATALADAKDREEARDVLGLLYGSDRSLTRLEQKNAALAARITMRQLEAMGLEKFRRVGDPMGVTDEFVASNVPERIEALQKELDEMVTQEALNERTLEIAKLFQGERALDYGAVEASSIAHARHDVYNHGTRTQRIIRPAITMAPHKMVNVNRPNSSVQVERFLRKTRAPIEQQDELLEQYLRATTPAERALLLNEIEDKAVRYALQDLDEATKAAVLQAAKFGRGAAQQALQGAERRYAGKLEYSLVTVRNGDETIHYPLMVSQTQDVVPMVDLDQLHRLVKRYSSSIRLMREMHPGKPLYDLLPDMADRFYRLWKPATLLRPAWPMRVVGDEQLRLLGKLHGMVHADWRRLGTAELDAVQGHQNQKVLARKGKRLELTDAPKDKLPRADMVAPERPPIDAQYANGEITLEEFGEALKVMAQDTSFVPYGYEDIWSAYRRGMLTEGEFLEHMERAALLRNNEFYFDTNDAERFYLDLLERDGLTVDVNTGTVPTKGYAVSTRPDLGTVLDEDELNPQAIADFIERNRSELLKPGRVLGAWIDEEDAVFDEFFPGMGPAFFGRSEPTLKFLPLVDEEGNFRGAGQGNLYGPGIYTTSDVGIARSYTTKDSGARRTPVIETPGDRVAGVPGVVARDEHGRPLYDEVTEPEDVYEIRWTGSEEPRFVDLDMKVRDLPEDAKEAFSDALRWNMPGDDADMADRILSASGDQDLGDFFNEVRSGYAYAIDDEDQFVKDLYEELGSKGYAGWTHIGGRRMGDRDHTVRIFFDPTKLEKVKIKKKGLKETPVYEDLPEGVTLVRAANLSNLPYRGLKQFVAEPGDVGFRGGYVDTAEFRDAYARYAAEGDDLADEITRAQGVQMGSGRLDVNQPVTVGVDDQGRMGVLDGGKRISSAASFMLDPAVPTRFVRVKNISWGYKPAEHGYDMDGLADVFDRLGVRVGRSFKIEDIDHPLRTFFATMLPRQTDTRFTRKRVYLDVSRVVKDQETAVNIGMLANQKSVFGLEDFDTVNTYGSGEVVRHRPHASMGVGEEEWRRSQEQIAYLTGEEVRPMDYDRLQGAYLGVSNYKGIEYEGPFGTGPESNQMWDLSSSRGALHNLAEHYERDGINQMQHTLRNWTAVEPHSPQYAGAWTQAVNAHIGQDPMARQFLEGKTYDEVVSWLRNTKEGIRHRKTLPIRGQNPEEWVGMVEDMVGTYLPSERLRRLALEGRAKYEDLVDEMGASPLPIVHGEELQTALGTSDYWRKYEAFTSKAFELLGGMPTDHLSRHPYFATMYHAKIRQALDTSIKQGTEITPEMITRLERMGREFALSETKKLLYDLAEQSDLARTLRFIAPFYGAWQETLTRWAGIAAEHPNVITRAHLIWDAPHKAGLVYNRQTGEPIYDPHSGVDLKDQVIYLRMPKWATQEIPGARYIPLAEQAQWLATFGGNSEGVTLSKGGFNLITMGEPWWLPGVGPSVQIPVNELIKDRPDLLDTAVGKYVLPYGPTNTGSTGKDILTQALPSSFKRLAAIPQDEGNAVFGNMKLRIYTVEMTKFHQGLRPKKPTWKEATWKARQLFSIWAVATWISPTGIAPISPVEPLVIEYRALLKADETKDKNAPGYMSPDAIFLEKHGEELFALTGSLTESANSAPATLGAYKATKKYESLIAQVSENGSPELAGLLIGKEGAGEFNYSVYQYQLNAETYPGSGIKQRRRFTPQEKIADRNAAAGWIEYRKIMDKIEHERVARGLSSLNVKEAADLRFLKDTSIANLRESNPDWSMDYDQVDRGVMRRRIDNLRSVIDKDPALRGRQDMKGVIEYLGLRDQVVQMLRERGGAKTLDAQSNADIKFLFDTAVGNLVERNLAFQDTYYRYLERDVLSASDKIGAR